MKITFGLLKSASNSCWRRRSSPPSPTLSRLVRLYQGSTIFALFITRVLVRIWKWKTTENRLKLHFFKPCVNSTTYTIASMNCNKIHGKKLRRKILTGPANFKQLCYTITNLNNSSICSRYDNNASRRYPYPLFHVLTQLSVCICISKNNIFVFDYDVYAFYFFFACRSNKLRVFHSKNKTVRTVHDLLRINK